jgi:hypothetical protein
MTAPALLRRPPARPLSPAMVRRHHRPLLLAAPAITTPVRSVPARDAGAGLRFFATCYASGLVFFLVMLS